MNPSVKALFWICAAGLACLGTSASATAECTLSLSQSQIELGNLRLGTLLTEQPGKQELSLGKRRMSLSIACPRPTAIVLGFNGTAAGLQSYRFDRWGRFTVSLSNALLDGASVTLAAPHDPAQATASRLMMPGQPLVVFAAGLPVSGRFFTAQVEIEAHLPASATHVRDETELQGQGSFELIPGG